MSGVVPPVPSSPLASSLPRLGAHAIASAIAGAVFVGLSIEAVAAGTVWALAMLAGLPWSVILGAEGLMLAGVLALTVMLGRHAVRLEARRAAGELV